MGLSNGFTYSCAASTPNCGTIVACSTIWPRQRRGTANAKIMTSNLSGQASLSLFILIYYFTLSFLK